MRAASRRFVVPTEPLHRGIGVSTTARLASSKANHGRSDPKVRKRGLVTELVHTLLGYSEYGSDVDKTEKLFASSAGQRFASPTD